MFWDVRKSEDEASEIENFLGKKERGQVEQWRMGRKAKQKNASPNSFHNNHCFPAGNLLHFGFLSFR